MLHSRYTGSCPSGVVGRGLVVGMLKFAVNLRRIGEVLFLACLCVEVCSTHAFKFVPSCQSVAISSSEIFELQAHDKCRRRQAAVDIPLLALPWPVRTECGCRRCFEVACECCGTKMSTWQAVNSEHSSYQEIRIECSNLCSHRCSSVICISHRCGSMICNSHRCSFNVIQPTQMR